MANPWLIAGVVVGSYLLGSVSPSVFLGKLVRHIDVREHGSGNPGTTNAFRVLGVKLGIVVLVSDILKGLLPILVCRWLAFGPLASVGVGLAAIVGHNWSVFLRGRGGKGIATTAGVIIGLMPVSSLIVVLGFTVMILLTRIVSVGSLFATLVFVATTLVGRQPWPYMALSFCAAIIIFYAHRGNLKRIVTGKEPRLEWPWKTKRPGDGADNEETSGAAGNATRATVDAPAPDTAPPEVTDSQASATGSPAPRTPPRSTPAPRRESKRVAPRGSS